MGTMTIILKQDILSLGEEGDIKVVKKGYARNYLFPNGLAMNCSKTNMKIIEEKKEYYEQRKLEKKDKAVKLKELLEAVKVSLEVPAGDKGRLFGTVTSTNIADELNKNADVSASEFVAEKKNIDLKDHIKFAGKYSYRIHLYQDIYAEMEVEVIAKIEKAKEQRGKKKRHSKRSYQDDLNEGEELVDEEVVSEDIIESTEAAETVEAQTETEEVSEQEE